MHVGARASPRGMTASLPAPAERKSFRRSGLGFGGDDAGGGGGADVGGRFVAAGGVGDQNIQSSAAAHYNKRGDSHRTLNSRIDTLQQKNLNNWVKATLISSAVRPKY